jgi:hypothetical protein
MTFVADVLMPFVAARPKRRRPAPQRLTVAVVLESKIKQIERWLYAFLLLRGTIWRNSYFGIVVEPL